MFTHRTIALLVTLSAPAIADELPDRIPFDVPWVGYDTAVYPEGIFPYASQSADFNGDGTPDLATVSIGGTAWLSILLGDGDGGYAPPVTSELAMHEAMDLAAADFDGDGDIDIVTSDTGRFLEGSTVSLYRNDGTGQFSFAGASSIGNTGPSGIVAADLDGDGAIDVATANDAYIVCNNTVSVLLNNGSGFFSAQVYTIDGCTNDIDAGDLDGDGAIDLVIGHETNRFTVLRNDAEGGFVVDAVVPGIAAGSIPEDPVVHIADVDLDGHPDVLFSNRDSGGVGAGAIGLWRNDARGGFGPAETLSFEWYNGGAIDIHAADVTGDGWPDLICATGWSGNWFLFESDGTGDFLSPRKLRAGHWPSAVDTPDLNGDGDLDVMILGAGSLEACVYLNPGAGAFVQPTPLDFVPDTIAPAFTTNIEAGDIDGDGDLDLVVGYRSDFESSFGISVRRNQGDGSFAPFELYPHFTYPVFVRLRDLDGDGDLDLLWNESDGRFRGRFNDGTGQFGAFVNSSSTGLGRHFDLYDVDDDGDPDVVTSAGFDVAVLRNNGAGLFMTPLYTAIDGFFEVIAMGDFDADGALDLLSDSAPQGYPQIAFGHGDGTFGPAFTVSTGRGVKSFGVGHLDDDDDLDFAAIYNLDEKGASIRRGRGDGGFFVPDHRHGSFQWDDYTTGGRTALTDIDADGDLDVLFANTHAQDFSLWRHDGTGDFDRVLRLGAGHNVHDLVTGDFTGDGVVDVAMSTQIDNGRWWYTGVVLIAGRGAASVTGDVDGDGVVGVSDLLALLGAWGPCTGDCTADLDGNGAVDVADLLIVLAHWS